MMFSARAALQETSVNSATSSAREILPAKFSYEREQASGYIGSSLGPEARESPRATYLIPVPDTPDRVSDWGTEACAIPVLTSASTTPATAAARPRSFPRMIIYCAKSSRARPLD